jgi:hypothetical protein
MYDQRQNSRAVYIGEALPKLVTVGSEIPVQYVLPREGGEIAALGELNMQAERKRRQEQQRNDGFAPKSRTPH